MKTPSKRADMRMSSIAENAIIQLFEAGVLPPGAVLIEGPIAERLGMSRAPVRLALQGLAKAGKVHRFQGRGFVIGTQSDTENPQRIDLRRVAWPKGPTAPNDRRENLASAQINEKLHDAILTVIPFGRFRISETELATFFGVSRAIAREALFHLLKRGLVDKDARSRWITGPLTAEMTRNLNGMRAVLEPLALRLAAPHLQPEDIARARARLAPGHLDAKRMSPDDLMAVEKDLHETCLQVCPNKPLLAAIGQAQLPVTANLAFARAKGHANETELVAEHLSVLDALAAGEIDRACIALAQHIAQSSERTVARLKILSILPTPNVPHFMTGTDA